LPPVCGSPELASLRLPKRKTNTKAATGSLTNRRFIAIVSFQMSKPVRHCAEGGIRQQYGRTWTPSAQDENHIQIHGVRIFFSGHSLVRLPSRGAKGEIRRRDHHQ
jgi:hypothetical protein